MGLRGRLVLVGAVCALASSLVSCGIENQSSKLSTTSNRQGDPLLIVIGGYNSCKTSQKESRRSPYGTDMYQPLQEMIAQLSASGDIEPKYVAACHIGEKIAMTSSWDEEVLYDLENDEAIDYLLDWQDTDEISYAMVAGHSYGGWLAMKFLLESEFSGDHQSIYTIDPISKVNCKFSKPWGCREAPSDINADERAEIADQTVSWINFYQDQTSYLHSSEIPQASENHKINQPHTGIDSDQKVWQKIYRSFANLVIAMQFNQTKNF